MKKRIIVLVLSVCSLCVALEVLSFLWLLGFPPFYRTVPVTIRELQFTREFWIGKRVNMNGRIARELFILENVPPYNCLLKDPNSNADIGVYWSNSDSTVSLNWKNVTVVGVMRKGYTHACCGWIPSLVYYIEAESITLSDGE
jgi:hypothetical protein